MKKILIFLILLLPVCSWAQQNQWNGAPLHTENGQVIVAGDQAAFLVADYPFTKSGFLDPVRHSCVDYGDDDCPMMVIFFDQVVGANYTTEVGTYILTVNGAPTRVNDATYPYWITGNQGYAYEFDSVNDYLNRVDDGSFQPSGDFSIQCVVTPHDVSTRGTIISKDLVAGNQRGWTLDRNFDDIRVWISNDGAAVVNAAAFNVLEPYRAAFITATYHYVGAANSEVYIYVDNQATASSLVMPGPVFDSAADLEIGSRNGGVNKWGGLMSHCIYWDGVALTEADHDRAFATWQGRHTDQPDNYLRVNSTSPPALMKAYPASGNNPFLEPPPANSGFVGKPDANRGGGHNWSDILSKWWRGSYESCDGGGHPVGHTITENAGAGAGTVVVDCTTANSALGGTSVLFTSDGGGAPKNADVAAACQTNWIGQDVTLLAWANTLTGSPECSIRLAEYSNANCTGFLADTAIWGWGTPASGWGGGPYRGTHLAAAWNGGTNSWYAYIRCRDNGAAAYTVVWDAAMAVQQSTTWHVETACCTDANSDASCTTGVMYHPSALDANPPQFVEMTVSAPWAGTDVSANTVLFTDGNVGAANSCRLYILTVSDEPVWQIYDNAAAWLAISPDVANFAADTEYTIRFGHGGIGDMTLLWNATWHVATVGAGTGIRSQSQTNSYIGGSNSTGSDVWFSNIRYYEIPKNLHHLFLDEQIIME